MMYTGETVFIVVCLINTLGVIGFLVWNILISANHTRSKKYNYLIKAVVMFFCPVVGPMFFLIGELFYRFFFHQEVNLEDVIFSKERVTTHTKADEERGKNMVPLEEAIAVSDTASIRTLMLNVIKGDIQKSLSAIALALNSEDSETSHYAASVLRDELNDFRVTVQKISAQIRDEDENKAEYAKLLISYMNHVLEQKVFTNIEQEYFVKVLEETGEILYETDKEQLESEEYEWICLRLLEIKNYEQTEKWCERGMEVYPKMLSSYTCQLKLYFTIQEQEKFFVVMEKLKNSKVVIDNETLELIRIFS